MQTSSLIDLGKYLKKVGYHFITITPASHQLVIERNSSFKDPLRDLLGWSLKVPISQVPDFVVDCLEDAHLLERLDNGLIRSKVRVSNLSEMIFFHSQFPTTQLDSVFFGPDTYRFFSFMRRHLAAEAYHSIFDIGCGSGAGGLALAKELLRTKNITPQVYLGDINPKALLLAQVNAQINGIDGVEVLHSDLISSAPDSVDLFIANPPYIMDEGKRSYRHGGSHYGLDLSLQIVASFLAKANSKAKLLLYTGSAVVHGKDIFYPEVKDLIKSSRREFSYEELDPDVFGEQLSNELYQDVERIAAIGLKIS